MPGTTAMHDITEGGIATAVEELGTAGGCRLRVDVDRIPVYSETRRDQPPARHVHPLGLIGSGSLLICCRPGCRRLEGASAPVGVQVTCIGEVAGKGAGVRGVQRRAPRAVASV